MRKLDAHGLTMRTAALIDATMICAASQGDDQAGWKAYGLTRRPRVQGASGVTLMRPAAA